MRISRIISGLIIAIYIVLAVSQTVRATSFPTKFLDNTDWILQADCQHEFVSSYEFKFNFQVNNNKVKVTGTWEHDQGRSGKTRAFGSFDPRTATLKLKNRMMAFSGRFSSKGNTTLFKGKFSDHPLDCEEIYGHIKDNNRNLFADARKTVIAKVQPKGAVPVKSSPILRSKLKGLVYINQESEKVSYRISKITPNLIEFDDGSRLYANFIHDGGKPYSPGHSNLETFLQDKENIKSGFLNSPKGTTMSYKVLEEWNDDYGMLWKLDAKIVGRRTVNLSDGYFEAVEVQVLGESIESTISSSWAEEGIKFKETILIDPKLKVILMLDRVWESTTSNSPPEVQKLTLKEFQLKNGSVASLKSLSGSGVTKSQVADGSVGFGSTSKIKIGKLNKEEIKALFSGDIKAWANVRGKKYFVTYYPGGTFNIKRADGQFLSTGRWWLENGKWCRSRPTARNKCFYLSIPRNPGAVGNWKSRYALDLISPNLKTNRVWIDYATPENRVVQLRLNREKELIAKKKNAEKSKRLAIAEAKKKLEAAKQVALEKEMRKAEEARKKRVADAKKKAEERKKQIAIAKAQKMAAEAKKREQQRQASELRKLKMKLAEAKRIADEAARRRAIEEARRKATVERKRRALVEARRMAALESRQRAERLKQIKMKRIKSLRQGSFSEINNKTECFVFDHLPKSPRKITWTGGCVDSLAEGEGVLFWSFKKNDKWFGGTYIGNLVKGKLEGFVEVSYLNGGKFKGSYRNHKRNGQGTFNFSDGYNYIGNWKNNKPNGLGTGTWPDGDKYVGAYKDGKFHGHGTYNWKNGDTYVGEYKNDNRHGQGTNTYSSGGKYVGSWKNDRKNGMGRETYSNGDKYTGRFWNGQRKGEGIYSWPNGRIFEGYFKNNRRHGQGTETYPRGHVYVGGFSNDKKHGPGTFKCGPLYVENLVKGSWRKGKKVGSLLTCITKVEARRRAVLEAKRKAAEEAKRQAAVEAKRKIAAEARRRAVLVAKRKAAEKARQLEWKKKGRPVEKGLKQKHFGDRIVILLPAEDILKLNRERNQDGRVSELRVLAGCKYDNGLLMNLSKSAIRTGGFDLIADRVDLFGSEGRKARFNFTRNLYPSRYFEFSGLKDGSTNIVAETRHNRYRNGKIRSDLSARDKNFFITNYGCLAQRRGLKMVLGKNDLGYLDPKTKSKLRASSILVLPFTKKEDPFNLKFPIKGLKVEFD